MMSLFLSSRRFQKRTGNSPLQNLHGCLELRFHGIWNRSKNNIRHVSCTSAVDRQTKHTPLTPTYTLRHWPPHTLFSTPYLTIPCLYYFRVFCFVFCFVFVFTRSRCDSPGVSPDTHTHTHAATH